MKAFNSLSSKIKLSSTALIFGSLILVSGASLEAAVATEIGSLQIISPPYPATPDPIYPDNLVAVNDDAFGAVLPSAFYPSPSLSLIVGQFFSYTGGGLQISPVDDNIILTSFAPTRYRDRSGEFFRFTPSGATFARSLDGGLTWDYFPPINPPIALGGTLAQQVGTGFQYDVDGNLIGQVSYSDMHLNGSRLVPMSGTLFSRSTDDGETWSTPRLVTQDVVADAFTGAIAPGDALHLGYEFAVEFDPDPSNAKIIHVPSESLFFPSTFYGNIFYMRSENGGQSWSNPQQIYSMPKDTVWMDEKFDRFYAGTDAADYQNYLLCGGQSLLSRGPVHYNKDTILFPIIRFYPNVDSLTYTQSAEDSTTDRGVVRSTDGGKTWESIFHPAPEFLFAFSHDPRSDAGDPAVTLIFDGAISQPTVVSPYTGRTYMCYMAGNENVPANPALGPNPRTTQQFFPYIALNMSPDAGQSWSETVQINATPTDISFDRQQALNPNMIMTQDGYLVVVYYDFRNWLGSLGEPLLTTVLNVDAWMDIYRETDDPNGGSTGVGLDFVEEIRLTPESFNGRLTLRTSTARSGSNYNSASGGGISLALNSNNVLYVTFQSSNSDNGMTQRIVTDMDPLFYLGGAGAPFGGDRGMDIDLNNRTNVFMRRFAFPQPSNQ